MSVCEWGIPPGDAWALSPLEWWEFWSWKYGKRKERMKSGGLGEEDVGTLREQLDEQLRKEARG
jgi:hypothetical protein